MNFFRFLDIEFQHKAIEISRMRSDTYSVSVAGEAQAQRMLLEGTRKAYKWLMVAKVIGKFWLVKLHLLPEPISPLIPKEAPPTSPPKQTLTIVPEGNQANEGSTETAT